MHVDRAHDKLRYDGYCVASCSVIVIVPVIGMQSMSSRMVFARISCVKGLRSRCFTMWSVAPRCMASKANFSSRVAETKQEWDVQGRLSSQIRALHPVKSWEGSASVGLSSS